jgi:hypothetical protein
LCLAATVGPRQFGDLASAVLARTAAGPGPQAGTVVLVLVLDGDIDAGWPEALGLLGQRLSALGTCLRLVITPQGAARQLRGEASASLAIHPNLRSAMLAAYAARLGPGLVTAQVRAALSAPAEPLRLRPREPDAH